MAYIENFKSKLDWAMPFQRTGKFPLDRSSIFSSYADALAYAKQDESDTRKLGGTSYVGQIVAVYGTDQAGTGQEVAAYIITAVGESASLMKLAQTTATGDFATDIARIDGALSALETRIKALEDAPKVVDTNTTYTFESAVTTDGAIKYTSSDGSTGEIQVKGWDALASLATGRTAAYVYKDTNDTEYLTALQTANKFKVGDLIYFTDNNIADQWVTSVSSVADAQGRYYQVSDLETEHPDLTQYLTSAVAEQTYAKKTDLNSKANQSDLTALQTTVTNNESANATAHQGLQNAIDKVADDLSKIDVTSQITTKINELNVNQVGGASSSYLTGIKQVNGKIEATASTLPDFNGYTDDRIGLGSAPESGDDTRQTVKEYVDTSIDQAIGDIGESADVKAYVDSSVAAHNNLVTTELGKVSDRVKVIEDAKYGDEISALKSSVGTNTSNIATLTSNLETTNAVATKARDDVSSLNTKVGGIETQVNTNKGNIETLTSDLNTDKTELNYAMSGRFKKIQIGGVDQTMSDDGTVNITEISTDLLKQGSNMLVFDCLNASLTDN